ncbi:MULTISPECIES: TA system toxin CbtA family protein [Pantoea]|uniref:TA system toxin CbtA family protein n=1 Tax=Pantoea TaxID=53335 RepID=UPI0025946C30|nr:MULTISPECIES: TA system toxin CbtA family protein [Pantoea]
MPYPPPGIVWQMLLISLLLQSCGLTLSSTLFNDENVVLKNEAGTYPNTEGNYDEK